jgi:hypothetical protein
MSDPVLLEFVNVRKYNDCLSKFEDLIGDVNDDDLAVQLDEVLTDLISLVDSRTGYE